MSERLYTKKEINQLKKQALEAIKDLCTHNYYTLSTEVDSGSLRVYLECEYSNFYGVFSGIGTDYSEDFEGVGLDFKDASIWYTYKIKVPPLPEGIKEDCLDAFDDEFGERSLSHPDLSIAEAALIGAVLSIDEGVFGKFDTYGLRPFGRDYEYEKQARRVSISADDKAGTVSVMYQLDMGNFTFYLDSFNLI